MEKQNNILLNYVRNGSTYENVNLFTTNDCIELIDHLAKNGHMQKTSLQYDNYDKEQMVIDFIKTKI